MWRGTLDGLRSQIAGMLATAKRTATNIPNIPKGIRTLLSTNTPAKVTAGPISQFVTVQ